MYVFAMHWEARVIVILFCFDAPQFEIHVSNICTFHSHLTYNTGSVRKTDQVTLLMEIITIYWDSHM